MLMLLLMLMLMLLLIMMQWHCFESHVPSFLLKFSEVPHWLIAFGSTIAPKLMGRMSDKIFP